ncbi:21141_t:CDS:1, partial [Racocetra persica]
YFNHEKTKSPGHFSAKCVYCPAKWSRGKPLKLEAHLAYVCPNVDNEIRKLYILNIASRDNFEESESTKKQRLNDNQP